MPRPAGRPVVGVRVLRDRIVEKLERRVPPNMLVRCFAALSRGMSTNAFTPNAAPPPAFEYDRRNHNPGSWSAQQQQVEQMWRKQEEVPSYNLASHADIRQWLEAPGLAAGLAHLSFLALAPDELEQLLTLLVAECPRPPDHGVVREQQGGGGGGSGGGGGGGGGHGTSSLVARACNESMRHEWLDLDRFVKLFTHHGAKEKGDFDYGANEKKSHDDRTHTHAMVPGPGSGPRSETGPGSATTANGRSVYQDAMGGLAGGDGAPPKNWLLMNQRETLAAALRRHRTTLRKLFKHDDPHLSGTVLPHTLRRVLVHLGLEQGHIDDLVSTAVTNVDGVPMADYLHLGSVLKQS